MAIEISSEHVLTLAEAARALPRLRGGRKVHVSTLYRWISRGVGGVRLEAVKIGRTQVTSREALQRFAERLTCGAPVAATNSGTDNTEQELDRYGL